MAQSANLKTQSRETLGSRASRKLRAEGKIPATLQPTTDAEHVDFAIDAHEFHATRRNHVHLYDLELGGKAEAAVVRELQWDAFGDTLLHVEFKRVTRGVATESDVDLVFEGRANGVVNHFVHHITISSIPSKIPDAIEINVDGMEEGDHIVARDLKLPEGVSLVIDPDTEIAAIIGAAGIEEPEEGETEEGVEVVGAASDEEEPEGEGEGESSEDED